MNKTTPIPKIIENAALTRLDEKNVQIQKLQKELEEKNKKISILEKLLDETLDSLKQCQHLLK